MSRKDFYTDEYDQYEDLFNPLNSDRQARRKRKQKSSKHIPKKSESAIVSELAATSALEGVGFETTYQPSRFEEEWLLKSLTDFYRQEFISDILAQIKGGKEASVYRCAAHPTSGAEFFAAKVYRPQKFRQLRNDHMYREGREILTGDGKIVKTTDHRIMRAIGKKTAFGEQVAHTSWLMYEFTTMQRLYQMGAAVPRPISAADNAILMSYHGDAHMAAPVLQDVNLEAQEAGALFDEVMRNVELMLSNGMIHGDLSAYNILYWQGEITLIDFPQVADSRGNHNAYFILRRDIERVCEYFARQGIERDSSHIMRVLWKQYVETSAHERAADESRLLARTRAEED